MKLKRVNNVQVREGTVPGQLLLNTYVGGRGSQRKRMHRRTQ